MRFIGVEGVSGEREVEIEVKGTRLVGSFAAPRDARGMIVFAHGSGSSRFSPRNRFVASRIRKHSIGTLLLDLLTQEEEVRDQQDRTLRFDTELLSARFVSVIDHLLNSPSFPQAPIGVFGASTGAAAAIAAAAERPNSVQAVVSRGGRPDLAQHLLGRVRCPTLFIVGELDYAVRDLNTDAFSQLHCTKSLKIVPGATHLFEEPGALLTVSRLAAHWFETHLVSKQPPKWAPRI